MKPRIWVAVLVVLSVLAGMAVQRYGLNGGKMDRAPATSADVQGKKPKFYRHPMNPAITADKPLKDEMGMDYIPIYDDASNVQGRAIAKGSANVAGGRMPGATGGAAVVTISPAMVNNMGVRTEPAERSVLKRRIAAVGYVSWDEDRIRHIHLRYEGWIERQHVTFVGEEVHKGDLLFEVFSPKLASAQEEYLQAVASGNNFVRSAARVRLRSLGLAEEQIAVLDKTRKAETLIKVYAPADGVVESLGVRQGMFVESSTVVASLVDPASVWVVMDVFPQQAAGLAAGTDAELRVPALPGKVWRGKLEYVYPSADPVTRTIKMRLRFDNPDLLLKPNMFAEAYLHAGDERVALSIPREALIRTGTESRVIVALGEGRFAARTVEAGAEYGERTEIISGLEEGTQVVTSGQFLLDSESNLKAGLQRLSAPDAEKNVVTKGRRAGGAP
ncbi:MAG: efflux RND transporter periplasmic adaptor subunit [Gammaproteobacteria bacterium]|nr:efflux RND transporter periplasmic adaptor subunit [Gammaproteobacteria bacterium]